MWVSSTWPHFEGRYRWKRRGINDCKHQIILINVFSHSQYPLLMFHSFFHVMLFIHCSSCLLIGFFFFSFNRGLFTIWHMFPLSVTSWKLKKNNTSPACIHSGWLPITALCFKMCHLIKFCKLF